MQNIIKHLEMIQNIISRMASNSFILKGWFITIFVAIVTVAIRLKNAYVLIAAIITLLAFWILDSYYLYQENLYRKLYDKVRVLQDTDFSMDTSKFKDKALICKAFFKSLASFGFYMIFLIIGILIFIFIWRGI